MSELSFGCYNPEIIVNLNSDIKKMAYMLKPLMKSRFEIVIGVISQIICYQ